jgi:putative flippase GtrA
MLSASHTAAIISGFVAMMTTFTLNNFWSFNERKIESRSQKVIGFSNLCCIFLYTYSSKKHVR